MEILMQRFGDRRSGSERCGVLLLVVLVTLAIVCLVVGQLAQVSLEHYRRTVDFERSRREHWTIVSVRSAVLPQIGRALQIQEERQALYSASEAAHVREFDFRLQLNGYDLNVTAIDENSRLSVRNLFRTKPKLESVHCLERISGLPMEGLSGEFSSSRDIPSSFRFLFTNKLSHEELVVGTNKITLWGNGKLNVLRAEDDVVQECWRQLFGHFPPRELWEARQKHTMLDWSKLRDSLDLREGQIQLAEKWFATSSSTYSVRVEICTDFRNPITYRLVLDHNGEHFGFQEQ